MIVCHCHAVNDREIRRLAEAGARTCEDIRRECGVGDKCQGCLPHVQWILQGVHGSEERKRVPTATAG